MDIKYCHFIVNNGLLVRQQGQSEVDDSIMERIFGENTRPARDMFDTIVAVNHLSTASRDLMWNLLQEDPTLRLTPSEALNHKWFAPPGPPTRRR